MKHITEMFKKRYNATVIHRAEIPQNNGKIIICETVLVNGENGICKLVIVREVARNEYRHDVTEFRHGIRGNRT